MIHTTCLRFNQGYQIFKSRPGEFESFFKNVTNYRGRGWGIEGLEWTVFGYKVTILNSVSNSSYGMLGG